jgi:hypothetical protein
MKKLNLLFASFIIASLSVFMACGNSSQKMERAESPIMKSGRDLDMNESEVLAEVQVFRLKTENEIKSNFRKIAALKDTIKTRDENVREDFRIRLEVLDNANREMKRTIDNFSESGRDQWIIFQDEFSGSMDDLANSLDNFFAVDVTKDVQ